jgi:hypothetical protein
MSKCTYCVQRAQDLGNQCPVGYEVFGWGPNSEEPKHYYVTTEEEDDTFLKEPVEVDVIALCEIPNPIKR